MCNLLQGKHYEKAQVIAKSLTQDVKIVLLTEATNRDVNAVFSPILKLFKTPKLITPHEKSAYHLALVDGSEGLNFALHVGSLYISVVSVKDSADKVSLLVNIFLKIFKCLINVFLA